MASNSSPKLINLPYKKLSLKDDVFDETTTTTTKGSHFYRFRRVVSLGGGRRKVRVRVRVKIRRLRRFVKKKASKVKIGILKVLKRLKESQSHFGDLFAGNYLFMQVNPSSLNNNFVFDKSFQGLNRHLHSKLSIPKVFM